MIQKLKNYFAIWGAVGVAGVFVMSAIGFCFIQGAIASSEESVSKYKSSMSAEYLKEYNDTIGAYWSQAVPLIILSIIAIAAIVLAVIHAARTASGKSQKSVIGYIAMGLPIVAHIFMMVLIIVLLSYDEKSTSRSSKDVQLLLGTMKASVIQAWTIVMALIVSILNTLISIAAFAVAFAPDKDGAAAPVAAAPYAPVTPVAPVAPTAPVAPVEQPAAPVEPVAYETPAEPVAAAPVEEPVAPEQPMNPTF